MESSSLFNKPFICARDLTTTLGRDSECECECERRCVTQRWDRPTPLKSMRLVKFSQVELSCLPAEERKVLEHWP